MLRDRNQTFPLGSQTIPLLYWFGMRGRAFGLSEITLAIGLFAVIALALVSLFVSNAATQIQGQGTVRAVHLAQSFLEQHEARPYWELEALLASPRVPRVQQVDGVEYTLTLSVERVSTSPAQPEYQLLSLTSRCDWNERRALDEGALRGAGHRHSRFYRRSGEFPLSRAKRVNNLTADGVSTDTNFRGQLLPAHTADIVVIGTCNLSRTRLRAQLHRGFTGNRSLAAVGKVFIAGDCSVDGIKSLLQPDPAAGGIVSKYQSTGPGDYAIEWDNSGGATFQLSPLSTLETAPARTGADPLSPNLRSQFSSQLETNAGAGTLPYYDISQQVTDHQSFPQPNGLLTAGSSFSGGYLFVKDQRFVGGDLEVNGDLVLSQEHDPGQPSTEGTLYIRGDLTVNGGIRGTGSVFVEGRVTINGGNTVIQTNQPTGVALLASGDVCLQGVSADGYLDQLATTHPATVGVTRDLLNTKLSQFALLNDRTAYFNLTNQLVREPAPGTATDYWVNPIPNPIGLQPDGHPEGILPRLTLDIKTALGASYSSDPRAQRVVRALEEMHYYFRHNLDHSPALLDAAGNVQYSLSPDYKLIRPGGTQVTFSEYMTPGFRPYLWDDDHLPPEAWTHDHLWHLNPPAAGLALMNASRDSFLQDHPLDFSWLGSSRFQRIVYSGGDIRADNSFEVVGAMVSQGDVRLTGGSGLTFNQEYLSLVGTALPIGVTHYEEL